MADGEQFPRSESIDRLMPEIYNDLRRIAASLLRYERPNHTLQPTDLVNEIFLQLKKQHSLSPDDRKNVIAIAAIMMRRHLVNYAKRRLRAKHGSGKAVSLDDETTVMLKGVFKDPVHVIALDEALRELATSDASYVRVVEMHIFGDLSLEAVAEVMNVSLSTVNRKWRFARAWLRERLT